MTTRTLPVRVWLAQRKGASTGQAMDVQDFRKRLCESFIPVTHQWMRLFGMTDYLVSLWPQGLATAASLPDESALVFYQTQQHYDAMGKTPTGKLYGAAHALVFEGGMNRGGYPSLYELTTGSELGKPYFGFDAQPEFNWSQGPVWTVAMQCPTGPAANDWVKTCVMPCLKVFPANQQWIAWATSGWMMLWVRCQDEPATSLAQLQQGLAALGSEMQTLFVHRLGEVCVPDDAMIAFPGIDLPFGQSARIVS